jgi:hypothetical protein
MAKCGLGKNPISLSAFFCYTAIVIWSIYGAGTDTGQPMSTPITTGRRHDRTGSGPGDSETHGRRQSTTHSD